MNHAQAGFRDPKILLPFILITLIWGSTWIVIKDQLGPVPAPWSVTYRFVIAAGAMFVIARATGANLRIGRAGHLLAAGIGIPQFFMNFNFVYAAEQHVTSGLVAMVFALLMVPNALFARLFFNQKVSGRFMLGSAVALAGVALLFVPEIRGATVSPRATAIGILFTMGGVLAASFANVMQLAPPVKARPIAAMLAWGMLYGVLFDAGFAFATAGPPVLEARAGYWIGLFYLGIVATALTFTLYFPIIRAVGPAKAAYSSVLIPIVAMAISTAVEGYRWTPIAMAGGALALAGMVIALRAGKVPATPPAD